MHFLFREWSETRQYFIIIAFHLCFRVYHLGGPRKSGRIGIDWSNQLLANAHDVNMPGENTYNNEKHTSPVRGLVRKFV
jgi:hypothetical protein